MWKRHPVDRRTLGEWSFELRDDEIADLALRGRRVLRSIRAVVRDRDWNTVPWEIRGVDQIDDGVALRLRSASPSIDAVVEVTASGDLFSVALTALVGTAFETNRTGLVVLHPPRTAGAALSVTHSDGAREHSALPIAISPHQPVFDIAGLSWNDDGVDVDLRFSGDVFEMEDQRNWTDASFKTYSRPLARPFPYLLAAGEQVVQTVTVRAHAEAAAAALDSAHDEVVLHAEGIFPAVSVGAATAPEPSPPAEPLGADLLVELDLATPTWRAALDRSAASGLPLDVRLVLTDVEPAGTLAIAIDALRRVSLTRITAFRPTGAGRHVSDADTIALLRQTLVAAGVRAPIVGGVRSHFTELNREHHRLPAALEGIVFSVTPLFHSVDTEQAVESIGIQRLVAQQAVEIAGGTPVHIGPVTLHPRFNDVATSAPAHSPRTDLTAGYGAESFVPDDPRQLAPELAAWTIASAAALAVDGVASLSYFEEWGARGIRSAAAGDHPVAEAIRTLSRLAGTTLLAADSPDGLLWAVGGARTDGVETVLVANLDDVERTLRVVTPNGRVTLRLGPHSWASAPTH